MQDPDEDRFADAEARRHREGEEPDRPGDGIGRHHEERLVDGGQAAEQQQVRDARGRHGDQAPEPRPHDGALGGDEPGRRLACPGYAVQHPHHPAPVDQGEARERADREQDAHEDARVGPRDGEHDAPHAAGDGLHDREHGERGRGARELDAGGTGETDLTGRLPHTARHVLAELRHDERGAVVERPVAAEQRGPGVAGRTQPARPQRGGREQPPGRRELPVGVVPGVDEADREERDDDHDEHRGRDAHEPPALCAHLCRRRRHRSCPASGKRTATR